MKNTSVFDILFIVIIGGILGLIAFFGYSKLLSQFSVIIALVAYFVGKYIGRIELRKKLNDDKPQ